jgi:hypothetical protein
LGTEKLRPGGFAKYGRREGRFVDQAKQISGARRWQILII